MTGLWDKRIGPLLWAGAKGLGVSLDAPQLWSRRVGLRAHFSNSISCPSPCVQYTWARAITFLVSGVISTCLLGAGLVRALSPSYVL